MKKKRLFGTRGIRGPIDVKVKPELLLNMGFAIAEYVEGGDVVVGRDARTSGEMLNNAFTAGLLAGGSNAIQIGIAPAPCVAFTARELGAKAGAIITASHNPPPDNGITFYHGDGTEFISDDEIAVEEILFDKQPKRAPWDSMGKIANHEAIRPYIDAIKKQVKIEKKLKIVVDCANGAASNVTPILLRELGCSVTTINSHLDGHFPGRHAEPQPWNLGDIMRVVGEVGADFGLAHDGDADRVAAIDEKGNFIKHDALIALFAGLAVEKNGGGTVVTSINTSTCIDAVVEKAGGTTFRTGLGRFTEEMLRHNACFAGEPGKLVFKDFGIWADGILASAKLAELVAKEGKKISEVFRERVPDYHMFHQDLACPDEKKQKFMSAMRENIMAKVGNIKDTLEVDGLRINRNDGSWVLVRVSGTEPKARVVVEARTPEELKRLKEIALDEVQKFFKQ